MDENIPTESNEEEEVMDVHKFVDEYIKKVYTQEVTETCECIEDETEMWLEVKDQEFGETRYDQYQCTECSKKIGDEDSDVFEHIRTAHPTVTGLKDKEPDEDQDEFEDA